MRVRSGRSSPRPRPAFLALLALAAIAPAASAQEDGPRKPRDALAQEGGKKQEGDETAAALEGEDKALVATDALQWRALTDQLFVSGERGITDPANLEPEPRQAFKFGAVSLLPKFDESVVYDSNVFLTEDDEEDDFILRTRAALLADWQLGSSGHRLSGGYDMLRHWFMQGDARNFVESFASGQLDLSFRHLRVSGGYRFEDRTDPILAVFAGKIERTLKTVHAAAGWYEDSRYFEVKAQGVGTQYDDANFQGFDRDERLAHAEYGWLVEEERWVFVRAGFVDRVFDEDQLNDMAGETASVGVRFQRAPSLDGVLRAGVRFEQFDDEVATDDDDDAINPEVEARLLWWPTRADGVDGRYVHTTEFSPVSNYEILDRAEIGWTRVLTGRVRSRAGVGVERIDPSDVGDTLWRYVLGAGVTWRPREYVDVFANWRVRIRATDAAGGDYTGHQVAVGVSVRL
jgi:hypothetical protein